MRKQDQEVLETILQTRGRFGHREHVELAWSYLQSYEAEEAHRAVASAIRHVAGRHGTPDKYHETITRFWVHLVTLHRDASDAESFEQFIAEHPELLDGRLLSRHYSAQLISSQAARTAWTEPDLRELPRSL
jgi:hypothetical protein